MTESQMLAGTLDCRGQTAERASGLVIAAFDALDVEEALLAEFDALPVLSLSRLQTERTGRFEWSPLAAGPGLWRVEIARRRADGARTVSEALAWDHDRLDGLEARAFELRARGEHRSAREAFAAFAHGLRRHIRFEEELVFPEFEARSGLPPDAGPTAVMRVEHRQILDLLDAIEASIADPLPTAERHRLALHEVLSAHNEKEEGVLYPGVDRLLGKAGADALVARIQAL